MARKRKHLPPRYLFVGAHSEEEAWLRLNELRRLVKPAVGRPCRVDRLREAMAIADLVPPTPWDVRQNRLKNQRRGQPKGQNNIVPRREERAVTILRNICNAPLTMANSTRIIEQAREIIDKTRGISPHQRKIIEQARGIVGHVQSRPEPVVSITQRECQIIRDAVDTIKRAPAISKQDRDLIGRARSIQERVRVH
jgi:hypothetical protein